uniref:Uncharacterized protein n=1 Tax=Zea mays TaxID=4577 RepID=A0A804UHB9_MAIZE
MANVLSLPAAAPWWLSSSTSRLRSLGHDVVHPGTLMIEMRRPGSRLTPSGAKDGLLREAMSADQSRRLMIST